MQSDVSLHHITPMAAISIALSVILPAIYQPTRWIIVLMTLAAGIQPLTFSPHVGTIWSIGSKMLFILLNGWLIFAAMAFDLRCEVREAMMDYLRTEMPQALVRSRHRIEAGEGFTRRSAGAG